MIPGNSSQCVSASCEKYRPVCNNTICMKREKTLWWPNQELISNEYAVFDSEESVHFHAIINTSPDGYQEIIQKTTDKKYVKVYTWWMLSGETTYQYLQVFQKHECKVTPSTHGGWTYTINYSDRNSMDSIRANPIISGNCLTEYTNALQHTFFKDILGSNTYIFYNKGQEWTWFSEAISILDWYK